MHASGALQPSATAVRPWRGLVVACIDAISFSVTIVGRMEVVRARKQSPDPNRRAVVTIVVVGVPLEAFPFAEAPYWL
jgi:hypothetical protein